MYRSLCPLRFWTIAVPGIAEPLGISRKRPFECLNRSSARPFWLVVWFSGTRGFARPSRQVMLSRARHTRFRQLSLQVQGSSSQDSLLDSDGTAGRCARVWQNLLDLAGRCPLGLSYLLMSQSRTSRRSDLAPCRLPTATCLVVVDL